MLPYASYFLGQLHIRFFLCTLPWIIICFFLSSPPISHLSHLARWGSCFLTRNSDFHRRRRGHPTDHSQAIIILSLVSFFLIDIWFFLDTIILPRPCYPPLLLLQPAVAEMPCMYLTRRIRVFTLLLLFVFSCSTQVRSGSRNDTYVANAKSHTYPPVWRSAGS